MHGVDTFKIVDAQEARITNLKTPPEDGTGVLKHVGVATL